MPTSTPRRCRTSCRTRRCATSARRAARCPTRSELGLLALLLLAACGNGGGGGPEAVVRGFAEAMVAGDLAKAKGYLPDDAACAKAPADTVERCKTSAASMRDRIADLIDDFPKGAKVGSIEKSSEPVPVPDVAIWKVTFEVGDDREESELFTLKLGDRYYAGFPFKVKSVE